MRSRYHELYKDICNRNKTIISLANSNHQPNWRQNINEADTVYYYLSRVKPGVSKKLQTKWIGPFTVQRKLSNSLFIIYPKGSWCKNARQITTIVSRLRKIDINYNLQHSHIEQVDMQALLDNYHDLSAEDIVEFPTATAEPIGYVGNDLVGPPVLENRVLSEGTNDTPISNNTEPTEINGQSPHRQSPILIRQPVTYKDEPIDVTQESGASNREPSNHHSPDKTPRRLSYDGGDNQPMEAPINEEMSPRRSRSLSIPAGTGDREYTPSPRPIFDRLAARTVRFRGSYDDTTRRSKRKDRLAKK